MAGEFFTVAYLSCLLLYISTLCGMLLPLFNVNMKTTEVEGDHQGTVNNSLCKNRSVLWTAIASIVLKLDPYTKC